MDQINQSELTDVDVALNVFSKIISRSKQGEICAAALAATKLTGDRISWGEENGKVVGVFVDGRRCDVNGNIIV